MEPLQLLFFVTVYCVSELQRSQTTALETNRTCSCTTTSCNFNQVCNPIPNCTRENVALGKLASISSSYLGSGPACLAVDGNTGTTYSSTNCIHSADNNFPAWWQVNLGRAYTVTNITVYIRGGYADRMDGVNITVDGQDCYVFPSGTNNTPEEKHIQCSTPKRGSLVRFQRSGLLNICEVQVWVCQDGFFGKDCNEPCAKCSDDLICDNYFGTCRPGDYCSCPFGCNYNQSCMTSNCRKENVALGKSANMSSVYKDINEPSGPACVAVNGNTGTMYVPTTQQNPNCIHTDSGDQNTWWEVDLGRNYTITDITIYMRKDQQKRMDNVRITVQGKECYNFSTGTSDTPPVRNVSCTTPVQGRIIRLSRSTDDYFLNFCEVQVWVCKPGLYGQNCDNSCNCNNNETCDNFYGSCPAGCSTGYYGFNCTQKCGSCKDISKCDSKYGQCLTGCQAGWQEPMCNEECPRGYYGTNCSQQCGHCNGSSTCNSTNGHCLTGCKIGWKEPMCSGCSEGFYGQNCSQQCGYCKEFSSCSASNGQCSNGCKDGFQTPMCVECIPFNYGKNCSIKCGKCKEGMTCNNSNGFCPDGCEDGYEFPLCIKTCSNRTYGLNCSKECGHCLAGESCNVTNGVCPDGCDDGYITTLCNEKCSNGMYGPNCSKRCGNCLAGSRCNATNGVCPAGCDDGYITAHCNQTCSSRMYGPNCRKACGHCMGSRSCNITNGVCPDGCEDGYITTLCNETCSNGTYGPNCSNECGHCLAGNSCNVTSGQCPDGCGDGYITFFCNESCTNRMYGHNCSQKCGQCWAGNSCDITNGVCPDGCDAGYNTSLCNEKCPNGKWGRQCNMTCGNCSVSTCRHDNGTCENGCLLGFTGDRCLSDPNYWNKQTADNTGLIVGIVMGVVLAVVILLGIFLFMRRRGFEFKARYFNSTRDVMSRHDGSNSSVPLSTEPKANKSTIKPKVAVKPTIREKVNEGASRDDTRGPVYENVVLGGSTNLHNKHQYHADDVSSVNDVEVQEYDVLSEDKERLYGNDEVIYAALKSNQNLDHIQRYLVDKLTSGVLLQEFKSLKKDIRKQHQAALLSQNIKKNRFKVIVPYDCNRVILSDGYEEGDATDYVNASFVKGVQSDSQYIAAQGPRDNTVTDFWRMVLQERVTDIVMLTSLQEGGKNKCYEYWPAKGTTQTYGPVKVTGLDVQSRAYFFTRTFRVCLEDGVELKVTQYHFTAWPDHGVPTVTSLVDFWRFVKSRVNACDLSTPLLVHCSAGVGRTGTFIGLDIGMDECLLNGKINIAAIVDHMRDDRTIMVQAPEQYLFLYKSLLEAYTGRETKLSNDQFETVISHSVSPYAPNERIDKEFQVVMQMRSLTAEQSHTIGLADENMSKNRSEAFLPSDEHIVYLTEHVPKRNQYINAVYLSTFTKCRGTILTQLPLPDTLVDFWRLIFGNGVTTIVSLGGIYDETNIENFCPYWPLTKDAIQIDPYCVTLKSLSRIGKHLMTYTLNLNKQDDAKSREIQVLRYEGWSSEIPDKSDIYQLAEILDTTNTTVGPIVIQCTDGVTKSGLFCCLRDIISRLTLDREVDVYMTVRHVQSVRAEAVTKVEQYRFCYEVAQEKVREQNVYANA